MKYTNSQASRYLQGTSLDSFPIGEAHDFASKLENSFPSTLEVHLVIEQVTVVQRFPPLIPPPEEQPADILLIPV